MPILGKRIEEAQAKSDTFVLILADIDGFKRINDTYTHEVGNSVLTQLAEVITPRSPGDVLIRYGGDEFLIITRLGTHATPSGYGFAERLRREVMEFSFLVEENSAKREKLTISCGITEYVPDQDDAKSIRRRVAEALHRAKQPREDGQSKNFSYLLRLEDLS